MVSMEIAPIGLPMFGEEFSDHGFMRGFIFMNAKKSVITVVHMKFHVLQEVFADTGGVFFRPKS